MTARTILIMAGGTGGHIMPGLAVADVLAERGWRIFWLGNPDKMEGRLVPARGYTLVPLRFQGLRGKGLLTLARMPFLLIRACLQASRKFREIRPSVVLGMGGYVAFPGGVIAALRGVPLVVHEQNAVAGTANRTLARLARRVLSGFPDVLPRAETVGNPVRRALRDLPPPQARYAQRSGALRVLVVGGSLGAQVLNTVVPEALAGLDPAARPVVVHQAGEQHLAALEQSYRTAAVSATCSAFIDDMAEAIGAADLVICRAGAMTVAEVAAAGVAALFIPLPHAIDDHQSANARYLSQADAAWVQPQSQFTAAWLTGWLSRLDREELLSVACRARELARPLAADHIADVCEQTAAGAS
jgi:UDP-N-acetylglucosamine--N-acetylmuramyl-(pentapeptide) pyrophosphoryl-undecaprenol N-acetylglucosamine transferase